MKEFAELVAVTVITAVVCIVLMGLGKALFGIPGMVVATVACLLIPWYFGGLKK